jgi:hypothetical protein
MDGQPIHDEGGCNKDEKNSLFRVWNDFLFDGSFYGVRAGES